jgi:hypothetical protein
VRRAVCAIQGFSVGTDENSRIRERGRRPGAPHVVPLGMGERRNFEAGPGISLGVYPEVSLRAARDRRDAARKLLTDEIDPQ